MEAYLGFAGSVGGYGGMLDIGGGSTEVMLGSLKDASYKHSFKIAPSSSFSFFRAGTKPTRRRFQRRMSLRAKRFRYCRTATA
jgi:exopolyphosphatase/pppGpp-phosphohydrolase